MANYAVKLRNDQFGVVAFDVVSASSASAAATAAQNDTGTSYGAQEHLTAIRENVLLSDTLPDLYGRIASNPG